MTAQTVWLKCDGCFREFRYDARFARRGVGAHPTAYHALTGEPMRCPWCQRGVRVVLSTPERNEQASGPCDCGCSDNGGATHRSGDEIEKVPVRSDCFRHGPFDAVFCPTCEKEAGR